MSKKVSGWPLIAPRELPEGLPAYTSADIGKVLTVINGLEETAFIPEQTITPSSDGQGNYVADLANVTLTPADFDSSSVATLTIDDGEEPVTVEMPYDENMSLFDMPGFLHAEYGIALVYNVNKWQFVSATETPEITVAAKATAISDIPNKGWEEIRQLPKYSASDNGKVLTVQTEPVSGAVWKKVDALPAIEAGDAGKVLTVNAGETGAVWAAPGGGGLFVTLTVSGQTVTADASYSDIVTTLAAGSAVIVIVDASVFGEVGNTAVFYPVKYGAGANVYGVQIGGAISGGFATVELTASTADDPLTSSME